MKDNIIYQSPSKYLRFKRIFYCLHIFNFKLLHHISLYNRQTFSYVIYVETSNCSNIFLSV